MGRYRRKEKTAGRKSIALLVLCLLAVMSIGILKLSRKDQAYIAKEEELLKMLEEEEQRAQEIDEYKEYVKSSQYIEDTARSKLGLIYEDEILFKEE